VPVAHDASGPAAINFTLAHPARVQALCILNSAYDDALPVHWPEMIELFATKSLNALSGAIAQSPEQLGWLLAWQPNKFLDAQPSSQQKHFKTVTERLIADNFMQQPSSGPAFVQMASDFFKELARNTARLPELKTIDVPVKVIWGEFDPYITSDVAKDRASHFKHASLYLLPGGHWVQSDLPEEVAKQMLT
jgi:haloalkane dehalogenase